MVQFAGFLNFWVVLSSTCLCIVMEYVEGGDLHDKIFKNSSKKRLDENMVCSLFLTDSKLQFCELQVL